MKKNKRFLILSLLFFQTTITLYSQISPTAPEERADFHDYRQNQDSTVYRMINNIFDTYSPLSYLSYLGPHQYKLPHLEALSPDEGGDGTIAEANIYLPFILKRGRDQAGNFSQRTRLHFDYNGQIRVVKAPSSPIVPPTNGFGLSMYHSVWDNFSSKKNFQTCEKTVRGVHFPFIKEVKSCKFDSRNFWNHRKNHPQETFRTLNLIFRVFHYSNGQNQNVFLNDNIPLRHDYKNGNFSTNNLKFSGNYTSLSPKNRLLTMTLGYQREIGSHTGFLSFEEAQERSYGKNRIFGAIQIRSKPSKWWYVDPPSTMDCKNCIDYGIKELVEYVLSVESEVILDNTDMWRQGNFDKQHRTNLTVTLEINPIRFRSIGFFMRYYYGRDYLNIRYDNVVSNFKVGVSFRERKYQPILRSSDIANIKRVYNSP